MSDIKFEDAEKVLINATIVDFFIDSKITEGGMTFIVTKDNKTYKIAFGYTELCEWIEELTELTDNN